MVITGAFGVSEWLIFKGNCACVFYFKHKCLHMYNRVAKDRDGIWIMSMLVKRYILKYVQGVRIVRGMKLSLLDHYVVLCKARLVCEWTKRKLVNGVGKIKG